MDLEKFNEMINRYPEAILVLNQCGYTNDELFHSANAILEKSKLGNLIN